MTLIPGPRIAGEPSEADLGVEDTALLDAGHLRDRLTRLARVTAELVRADSVDAVTTVVTSHGADAVGATIASLTLLDGEDELRLLGLRGGRDGDAQKWAHYPVETRTPSSDVVRTGQKIILSGQDAIADRYPHLDSAVYGERSIISLPLQVSSRTIGAIGLSFPGLRTIDSAELEFLEILADTCAQALDRIRAQDQVTMQSARLAFLADASTELSRSLDYEATLAKVAQLAVPNFADWCAIDVVEDGRLHRVAVQHVDPEKVQLALDLQQRYPSDPDSPNGAWNVMRPAPATGCRDHRRDAGGRRQGRGAPAAGSRAPSAQRTHRAAGRAGRCSAPSLGVG